MTQKSPFEPAISGVPKFDGIISRSTAKDHQIIRSDVTEEII
jgi:hypothetical protein